MSRFIINVGFIKLNDIKFCLKIKLNDQDEWYYFHPNHQIMCLHIDKFRTIYDFKKYKTASFNLRLSEFKIYFNLDSNRFKFKDHELLTEESYRNYHNEIDQAKLIQHYQMCKLCKYVHIKRSIRKRKKLTSHEKLQLIHDVGMGYSKKSLSEEFTISSETIRKQKNKLKFNDQPYVKSIKQFTSITKLEQTKILSYIKDYPFDTLYELKRNLRLQCCRSSIRNFLRSNGVRAYLAQRSLYHLPNHINMRRIFCEEVLNFTDHHWRLVVFSDEKTLQNFHNGRIRVYRKRKLGQSKRYFVLFYQMNEFNSKILNF